MHQRHPLTKWGYQGSSAGWFNSASSAASVAQLVEPQTFTHDLRWVYSLALWCTYTNPNKEPRSILGNPVRDIHVVIEVSSLWGSRIEGFRCPFLWGSWLVGFRCPYCGGPDYRGSILTSHLQKTTNWSKLSRCVCSSLSLSTSLPLSLTSIANRYHLLRWYFYGNWWGYSDWSHFFSIALVTPYSSLDSNTWGRTELNRKTCIHVDNE